MDGNTGENKQNGDAVKTGGGGATAAASLLLHYPILLSFSSGVKRTGTPAMAAIQATVIGIAPVQPSRFTVTVQAKQKTQLTHMVNQILVGQRVVINRMAATQRGMTDFLYALERRFDSSMVSYANLVLNRSPQPLYLADVVTILMVFSD